MSDVEPGRCCDGKVQLLDHALAGKRAWVSGVRRQQTVNRERASIIEIDRRGLVKVNPVAQWSDDDRRAFMDSSDVIRNPLLEEGYTSIGCRPCTTKPGSPSDARSGRWAGTSRTECGLHL